MNGIFFLFIIVQLMALCAQEPHEVTTAGQESPSYTDLPAVIAEHIPEKKQEIPSERKEKYRRYACCFACLFRFK